MQGLDPIVGLWRKAIASETTAKAIRTTLPLLPRTSLTWRMPGVPITSTESSPAGPGCHLQLEYPLGPKYKLINPKPCCYKGWWNLKPKRGHQLEDQDFG